METPQIFFPLRGSAYINWGWQVMNFKPNLKGLMWEPDTRLPEQVCLVWDAHKHRAFWHDFIRTATQSQGRWHPGCLLKEENTPGAVFRIFFFFTLLSRLLTSSKEPHKNETHLPHSKNIYKQTKPEGVRKGEKPYVEKGKCRVLSSCTALPGNELCISVSALSHEA